MKRWFKDDPNRDARAMGLLLAFYGLAGVVMIAAAPDNPAGWFVLKFIGWYLSFPLVVLLHESAHALVAHGLGYRVDGIDIGKGDVLWRGRLGAWPVAWHVFPDSGVTRFTARSAEVLTRPRLAAIISAGIVVQLLLLLILLPVWDLKADSWHILAQTLDVWDMLFVANAVTLLNSLIPYRVKAAGMALDNDALYLIRLLINPHQYYYRHLLHLGHYEAAQAQCQSALAKQPDDLTVRLDVGYLLIMQGRYAEAVAHYRALIREDESATKRAEPEVRALMHNNLACSLLELPESGADELAQADASSDEALTIKPDHPNFAGTRGAVLVMLGRADEAKTLLESSLTWEQDETSRRYKYAWLSVACRQLGQHALAQAYYQQAGSSINADSRAGLEWQRLSLAG